MKSLQNTRSLTLPLAEQHKKIKPNLTVNKVVPVYKIYFLYLYYLKLLSIILYLLLDYYSQKREFTILS